MTEHIDKALPHRRPAKLHIPRTPEAIQQHASRRGVFLASSWLDWWCAVAAIRPEVLRQWLARGVRLAPRRDG